MIPSFNLSEVESRILELSYSQEADRTYRKNTDTKRVMLNYYCQADSIKMQEMFGNVKSDTVDINFIELSEQAVKEHKDIHKLTASKMFNVPYDKVTDEQRRAAKTCNFRCMYK